MKMTFSNQAWLNIQPYFEKITTMDFIQELMKGTLSEERFLFYLYQDSAYLSDYGKILASISSRLYEDEYRLQFMSFALGTIEVEKALHSSYFKELKLSEKQFEISPSCMLYTSYLHKLISIEPIEVAMAGVLPCFRVYQEVGDFITKNHKSNDNPFQQWIDTYGDINFTKAVRDAEAICDQYAKNTTDDIRKKMFEAYEYSTKMEFLFWDSAYELEKWKL